ncbi:MAG: hypothetical protein M3132_05050 [Actinomycetia bacterium]|nr:hypothetical protein [Actinomycetes bacterium]
MRTSKLWMWVLGAVCGAELVIAATIGGLGIGAFFGLEGALVGLIATTTIALLVAQRLST